MGSVKYSKSGKESHWTDVWSAWSEHVPLKLKQPRQRRSLPGQMLLFDTDSRHVKQPPAAQDEAQQHSP